MGRNCRRDPAIISIIIGLILVVVIGTGWVMNIVSLIGATGINGLEIARAIGIFVVPLGTVLGYFF